MLVCPLGHRDLSSQGLPQELSGDTKKKEICHNGALMEQKRYLLAPQANVDLTNNLYLALLKLKRFQEFLNLAKRPGQNDFLSLLGLMANKFNTESGYNVKRSFFKRIMSDISRRSPLSHYVGYKHVDSFYAALSFGFYHFSHIEKKQIQNFFFMKTRNRVGTYFIDSGLLSESSFKNYPIQNTNKEERMYEQCWY